MIPKSHHLSPGTLLQDGRYSITRFIGSGGFGCTYEAKHNLLDTLVVIKEFFVSDFCNRDDNGKSVSVGISSKHELVAKLRNKFINEARKLRKLEQFQNHNIVRVSDLFEENGTAYYVMDYITGESLQEKIKREGPLSETQSLKYIRQICNALETVHSQNILHLDIKPGNIMVNQNDNAVLIDFGAAKQYDDSSKENNSTVAGYTPGYAPLEQISNNMHSFTAATDIYALGATLFTLLTAQTPPSAGDLSCGSENLPALPRHISPHLNDAIHAAMSARIADRPQSVAYFSKLLDTSSDETLPINSNYSSDNLPNKQQANSVKAPKKHKKRIVIATLATLLLVGLLSIVFANSLKDSDIIKKNDVDTSATINNTITQENKLNNTDSIKPATTETETAIVENVIESIPSQADGKINGHGYVDMGNGIKWACCNLGASSPEGYGKYFAWGETSSKSSYTTGNSTTYRNHVGIISGESEYDAAKANLGASWTIPTKEQVQTLINNTTSERKTINGVSGMLLTSKINGKSIFLPAAGYRYESSTNAMGNSGYYWTASPYESLSDYAYGFQFNASSFNIQYYGRDYGQSIRAIAH